MPDCQIPALGTPEVVGEVERDVLTGLAQESHQHAHAINQQGRVSRLTDRGVVLRSERKWRNSISSVRSSSRVAQTSVPASGSFGVSGVAAVIGFDERVMLSAFSIFENRSSISSCMWSVLSWRCATSSPALRCTSYSISLRIRSRAAERLPLNSSSVDSMIASSETVIVSRLYGN